MNDPLDLYLRAHTVVLDQAKRRSRRKATTASANLPKWPDYAVVFGCESRTGITQELTFGFYRILKLNGDSYVLEEEGGFFDDDLPLDERKLLGAYFRIAVSDKTSFPPNFPRLSLALGIGANTAIFQLIDAVRMRVLPVAHPEELAVIRPTDFHVTGRHHGRYGYVTNQMCNAWCGHTHGKSFLPRF